MTIDKMLEAMARAIVNHHYGSDSPGYDACVKGAMAEAKDAAIAMLENWPTEDGLGFSSYDDGSHSYGEIKNIPKQRIYVLRELKGEPTGNPRDKNKGMK